MNGKHPTVTPPLLAVALMAAAASAPAQETFLLEISDLTPHELVTRGFVLNGAQDVRIQAVGAERPSRGIRDWFERDAWDRAWAGNAWILDARTRDVVWELRRADTEKDDDLRLYDGEVRLPAGEYIVHYASYSGQPRWGNWSGSELRYDDDGRSEDFRIIVNGQGRALHAASREARDAFTRSAFVSFSGLGPDARRSLGFEIQQTTEVEIYAIGEITGAGAYDYAWLIDTESRRPVWKMEERGTRHAGGADKNRMVREVLTLAPGRYAAVAVTDDSHHSGDWNAPPPFDPGFWGLTIRAREPAAVSAIRTFAYSLRDPDAALVSLTGLSDDRMESQGFGLNRRTDLRVYALGEATGGRMHDYGWIIDASTRRTVWQMEYEDTEHAGGAQKNRMVDEVITLEPGDYLVYYTTDDSHSASDWNAAPPLDREAWGITLSGADGALDRDALRPFDPAEDPSFIAQIIGVRDSQRRREPFNLAETTQVRIYALGEGDDDHMYDFAWIEDAETGRIVWEMTHRMTEHAGGARKNRMYDGTIVLAAGDYVLHYQSDGSHSFGDWNADPPADPHAYGVTLQRERS